MYETSKLQNPNFFPISIHHSIEMDERKAVPLIFKEMELGNIKFFVYF